MERGVGRIPVGGSSLFIYRDGVPVAAARVRGASARGLSIETRYTGYRLLQVLDICLTLNGGQGGCSYCFAPLVSRRGRTGLGLTVVDGDVHGVRALAALRAISPAEPVGW